MNAADFFKILTNLKIFGEYQDGNTHYWSISHEKKQFVSRSNLEKDL